MNNQRRLLSLDESQRAQLSSGTTSVEVLHTELNNRFRFHGAFYQSTLQLTLCAFSSLKLMTHNSAEYCPTLKQTSQRTVAAHTLARFRLSDSEWAAVRASACPLVARRLMHKTTLQHAIGAEDIPVCVSRGNMLPGVRKRPASQIKRHTFNKKRESSFL